jgi:hypothetical protein
MRETPGEGTLQIASKRRVLLERTDRGHRQLVRLKYRQRYPSHGIDCHGIEALDDRPS